MPFRAAIAELPRQHPPTAVAPTNGLESASIALMSQITFKTISFPCASICMSASSVDYSNYSILFN